MMTNYMPYDQVDDDLPSDLVELWGNDVMLTSSFVEEKEVEQESEVDKQLKKVFDIHNERELFIMGEVKKIINKLKQSAPPMADISSFPKLDENDFKKRKLAKYPPPDIAIGTKLTVYYGSDSHGYQLVKINRQGKELVVDRVNDEGRVMRDMSLTLYWRKDAYVPLNRKKGCVAWGKAVNYRDLGF